MESKPEGLRSRGLPKLRWLDADEQSLGIGNRNLWEPEENIDDEDVKELQVDSTKLLLAYVG